MKKPFREHHLIQLLDAYDQQKLPLDLFINLYFRSHKALGSKDRGYIAETTYFLIRWQGLIDHLISPSRSWQERVNLLSNFNWKDYQNHPDLPAHIKLSCPENLYNLLVQSYGPERTRELCLANNSAAPTTIRVNSLKTERDQLLEQWRNLYEVIPCHYAPTGITFLKKINFYTLPEFKDGLFEVQDEGSQLLADLIQCSPGQLVLDFCAGAGGKTLAFAPSMQNKGQIFLHDVRIHALQDAKKRLRRAGIQNAQIFLAQDPKQKQLKKKMDWVLVDAPCSGTGTLRRNPDMKWKFNLEMVQRLSGQQRTIFEKALSFMKPEGRIVYSTCSVLPQENEEQMHHFMKTYNLKIEGSIFQSFPSEGGMDGFFGVVLKF
ncbi:MAG: SAM-dependent methyltransferase [Chlamydiales bacterium 38-26]|nr:RsmB/NOP family class I SAM-dependent RNA methyltransferase [Chlamydiales bacterium]OJV07954.1 MAG: SAM-dependent methyltransferase [Chlamydiales bacterium 38-26]